MGFATGSVSMRRFFICGEHAQKLTEDGFAAIAAHAFGRGGEAEPDQTRTGWIVPTHLFDVDFSTPERITVGRYLYLAMRVDRTAAPPAVIKSYRKMEEEAAIADADGRPLGRTERTLARQVADDRAAKEAREGRFRRIAAYPVVIDLKQGVVYFGNPGATAGDKLAGLFADTFNTTLAPATAEETAFRIAEGLTQTRAFEDAQPEHVAPPPASSGDAPDTDLTGADRSFFGREFLTWLWFRCDADEGLFELDGGGSATVAIDRSIRLECGYGVTGKTTIQTDLPAVSPEGRAALRIGKQPTKLGLLIGSSTGEWSLTLDGPKWSVSGLVLPPSDEADAVGRLEERFDAVVELSQVLDSLLGRFLRTRLGDDWPVELTRMRHWVSGKPAAVEAPLQRATA